MVRMAVVPRAAVPGYQSGLMVNEETILKQINQGMIWTDSG